jgi:hypothetical protein
LVAKLTRQRLKRGVFTSIVELQTAINGFIADANDKPKPFVWTKSADAILAAVQRGSYPLVVRRGASQRSRRSSRSAPGVTERTENQASIPRNTPPLRDSAAEFRAPAGIRTIPNLPA